MSVQRSDGPGPANRSGQVSRSKPGSPAPTSSASAGGADRLELSPRSVEIGQMRDAAAALPEIRAERVEALQRRIRIGDYRVDPRALARRLVEADVL